MAGLYIHVPFCAQRCSYCDFYSQTDRKLILPFVDAVIRELESRCDYLGGEQIETVYFGGGTPSLLQPSDFRRIFDAIASFYDLSPCREITLEANPDDIDEAFLESLGQLPFNRISLGVQSFDDRELVFLNRRHDSSRALRAIDCCRQAGYHNLSIDLMYGLPNQSAETWQKSLSQAIELDIPHLSAYHLSYEEGTVLYRQLTAGRISPMDEDTSLLFFRLLIDCLREAGYLHYEISNFCRPDCFAQHNTAYWTGRKYLGIGPSAHSYDGASRQWNVASIKSYIEQVAAGIDCFEQEQIDAKTGYNDYVITRLRTMWGVRSDELQTMFGKYYAARFRSRAQRYIDRGLLRQESETFILTDEGICISDHIFADLME